MPLSVVRLNHVNQVVADYAAANAFYRDVFGAVQYADTFHVEPDHDASLLTIGSTPLEVFAPRSTAGPMGASLARFGPSFHSVELQVDDLDAARRVFEDLDVRIAHLVPGAYLFTHPKDGHGLMFEACPTPMAHDPRLEPGWTDRPWRDGPLGLLGLRAMGVAVTDLTRSLALVLAVTGGEVVGRGTRPGVGEVAGVRVADLTIELVQPGSDESPVAAYIARYGPRIRSLDFAVKDVDAVGEHLAAQGLRTAPGDCEGWLALDPDDNHGALYQFCVDA